MQAAAVVRQALRQTGVRHRKDLCRKQAGIETTTDGNGGHRNATWHLHDGVERIHSGERPTHHRDADHRQGGEGRHHPGQMGSPSSPGDNYTEALITGFLSEIDHFKRRAVSRKHPDLHLHSQLPQDGRGGLHGGQVGIAAHHQGHTGKHCRHSQ